MFGIGNGSQINMNTSNYTPTIKIHNVFRLVFLSFCIFCGQLSLFAQFGLAELMNDSIEYEVFRTSPKILPNKTFAPSSITIEVSMSITENDAINNISNEKWIQLLRNDKTCWSANLILYQLHQKDAWWYFMGNGIKEWQQTAKKSEDINYWLALLEDGSKQ